MAYLAPISRPGSVRHAIKLNLLSADEECLVLAKANRLEIWTGSESHGLQMVSSKAIYGRVCMLQKIRPHGSTTDHLFIGTIRFQYFTVAWNREKQRLDTIQSFVDISEKNMKESLGADMCLIDPKGQYMVLHTFDGILNFVKLLKPKKKGTGSVYQYLDTPDAIRITEFTIRSMTFLYTETNRPKLAILYQHGQDDQYGQDDIRLATYSIIDERGSYITFDPVKDRENDLGNLDPGASHLIPVPKGEGDQRRYIVRSAASARAQLGGVIIVGETKMTYLDDESKATIEYALDEASIFISWERFDALRYVLADKYGVLHLLSLHVDGSLVTSMTVTKIGQASKATILVYMWGNTMFIGSHEDDSQVVDVNFNSQAHGQSGVEVINTMPSLSPILDFEIMDMGSREGEAQTNEFSSGQARLVTGSGMYQGGSLRSVRSGVGLEDLGILADIGNVSGIYSLRSDESNSAGVDTLLISLVTETRVFRFDSHGEVEELEQSMGLKLDARTLYAATLLTGKNVQVIETAVMLSNGPTGQISSVWNPPPGGIITSVSANEKYILLSISGTCLVSLDIQTDLRVIAQQNIENGDQISCVHVPTGAIEIGIVGFWKSGSISILDLNTLSAHHSIDLRGTNDASVPRDILLAQILPPNQSGPMLFVAMEDGIVMTFSFDLETYSLSGRKSIVLGTQQTRFQILPRDDGLFNVFATCEHPSLIYGSEGRIIYSSITAENAICVCPFDNPAYPGSIIVATDENVKISQIDTERRTHVRTLHIGETIRRIAYSQVERAFGIGTISRVLNRGAEVITSSFRLVDEVLLSNIGKPFILQDSNGSEIIECCIRADLSTEYGDKSNAERFIVGTSFVDEIVGDARGRILVLGIDQSRNPYLIHSQVLKASCRRVTMLDGKIVAALMKTVVIYAYSETTETSATLTRLASYRTSTYPIDLAIDDGNIIAVADLTKSVSLIEYIPGENGLADELREVSRHYQTCFATAVVHVEGDSYLESDGDGNIIVLRRTREGITAEDRKRMEITSEMNLGEPVNKIRKINVQTSEKAMVIPKAFLATTEGSIYLFSTISPTHQDLLMRLQARMSTLISTLGNMDFNTYRAFRNRERETTEPFRFVDGELIERFLDVPEQLQTEICDGLGPSVEDVRSMVEELKRLH